MSQRARLRRMPRRAGAWARQRLTSLRPITGQHEAEAVRAEVAELRHAMARLRSDVEAELALLRAELAASLTDRRPN